MVWLVWFGSVGLFFLNHIAILGGDKNQTYLKGGVIIKKRENIGLCPK